MQNEWYLNGPSLDSLPKGREPSEGHQLGDLNIEPLAVFLAAGAASSLENLLASQAEGLAAGILLGHVAHSQRPFLLITAVVAVATGRNVRNFNFSDEMWQELSTLKNAQHPDTLVVGWFISQPGISFLADENACQQHNRWFTHPWQVFLAIDPQQYTSRFYRWENGNPVPLDNFAVWNQWKEPPATLLADTEPNNENEAPVEFVPEPIPWWRYTAWVALILLLLLLLFWRGSPVSIPNLRSMASQRQAELELLQQDLSDANQTIINQQIEAVDIANVDNDYIIKPGDTLWAISLSMLGSPHEYHRLAAANGITDPSLIYPGRRLALPEEEH